MKRKLLILFMLCFAFLFVGCGNKQEDVDIYASIYPVEFLVTKIVKGRLKVNVVYPRGKDVHDYQVSPRKIINMSRSKIVFCIGLGLEPVIQNSISTVLANVPVISLSEGLTLIEYNSSLEKEEGDEAIFYDPHIWLDPKNMKTMATTVYNSIVENIDLEEDDITFFNENLMSLRNELEELHIEFLDALSNENIDNKTIMVDHDAYGYWQSRYGIKRIRIRNENESTDISPKDIIEKVNQARELGIKYICTTKNEQESKIVSRFLLDMGLDKSAKRELHHLGTITAKEEKTENYFSLMRYNLQILCEILPKKS